MDLQHLVTESIANTKLSLFPSETTAGTLYPFGPETVLCITIFAMLLIRFLPGLRKVSAFPLALAGSIVALYLAAPWRFLADPESLGRYELFTGMLVFDTFAIYLRAVLLLFAVLFAVFTRISGIPDKEDSPDFYCLVLGATLGMCMMSSANHLLMIFLAVEMASVPSYALAAMLKGRRESSEAALKYSVYGAGAAGVMLYGISLLAGVLGTCHLPSMALQLADQLPTMPTEAKGVLALGGLMLMVGLSFKLSAVPFHFWCPDVFEGASAEVGAFLSVASKAAALALLVRIAIGLGTLPDAQLGPPGQTEAVAGSMSGSDAPGLPLPVRLVSTTDSAQFAIADSIESKAPVVSPPANDPLEQVRRFIALVVAVVSVVTCTFGNLAAYGQTNIKRLLAYSTIAHAGYMLMAIPAAMELAGGNVPGAQRAIAALAVYIAAYLFMNLGAFAIVAFLRNALRSEEIADYSGLIRNNPGIVVCFAIVLFSLVGIPPLIGFVGKFAIFASLAEAYESTGHGYLLLLLFLGGLNTVISLFYYLRVVKVMAIDPPQETIEHESFSMLSAPGLFTVAITVPLILLFLSWNVVNEWSLAATSNLF